MSAPSTGLKPAQVRPLALLRIWISIAAILMIAAIIGGGIWLMQRGGSDRAADRQKTADPVNDGITVDVIHPKAGGIDRVCIQPGTIEPFESADLYAKVSGFLIEQSVDIGSRVKAGQELAKLWIPEHEKQVKRDVARVEHAEAVVKQMQARILAADADAKSAKASVSVAKSQVKAKTAYRRFREKQLVRLKELNAQRAIDAKVVDESEDQFEAALEAESSATENIITAEQKLIAATAKIDQAKADLEEAQAEVRVAAADLERSRVLVSYSVITSPYNGVITKRSFNRGDFIRSADVGGDRMPLFSVERTDLMRVIVQIPDRDVPFTDRGDAAVVEIDALPDASFKTVISRVAESEDIATRTMRTEIDLPNNNGKLRRGMYGRVTLLLESGHPEAVTIPSSALTKANDGSRGTVKIVREKLVHIVPVIVGADNGIRTEILSGLRVTDQLIVRANGSIDGNTPVKISGN